MSLGLKIEQKGLRIQIKRLKKIGTGLVQKKRQLNQRFGILALQWIDRQFSTSGAHGGAPWKKLSVNTIAGRRKGSSKPLLDTRNLQRSFTARTNSQQVRVGTNVEYAPPHEFGTKPFTITAKPGKILAFPVKGGTAFAKKVNHPGIPQRKILPTTAQMLPIMVKATQNFIKELEAGSGNV